MKTAILIVSHNTRDDVRACLLALLESGAPAASIFVADNASEDGTGPMLLRDFPHVQTTLYERNWMYAQAVNDLWRRSDSDWSLLLNPDVVGRFDELKTLPDKFEGDRATAAVAPQCRYFDGRVQPSCRRLPLALTVWREALDLLRRRPSHWKMQDFDHRSARAVEQPMFSCLWIRRQGWQEIGELDTSYPLYFNDVDWCRRAQGHAFRIQFDPTVAVLHKRGGTTLRYPMRKWYQSNRSFLKYIQHSPQALPQRAVGMAGVFFSSLLRLPRALLDLRRSL